jgi:hypothetical protein
MKLQLIKNIQFTKLIKAEGRLREFNFRQYGEILQRKLYSVNVTDDKGNRISFDMQQLGNDWKIVQPQLPAWILENETNFQRHIKTELENRHN